MENILNKNKKLFILFIFFISVTAYAQISLKKFPDDKVMVVAHRADWREAPENSVMAVKKSNGKGSEYGGNRFGFNER